MKQLPQWRTWSGLLILGVMMIAALLITRNSPAGAVQLPSVISGLGALGLWLAGKSAIEHSTNAKAAPPTNTPPPV